VAWVVHVWVDSTMGSVGPSSSTGGSVDLDVGDDQLLYIQSLDLSIGFDVLQQSHDDVDTLLRPSTLG